MSSSPKKSRLRGSRKGMDRDSVVVELLQERRSTGSTLVVNDLGRMEGARWNWMSFGETVGQPEPPQGPFEQILMRLPRARRRLEFALHLAASQLKSDGELILAGMNDEGIRSAKRQLSQVFEEVETVCTKRHGRVWRGGRPRSELRSKLEGWLEEVEPVEGRPWVTLPGVFAKGAVDRGTKFLLEHLPDFSDQEVLDFGAGGGVVASHLVHRARAKRVVMLEADALAGVVASRNMPQAELVISDGWARLAKGRRFDGIVSNPPIHSGKDEDFRVLRSLIQRAPEYLHPGGRLILVVQRQVPVMRLFKGWSGEVLAEDNQFWVIQAVKI